MLQLLLLISFVQSLHLTAILRNYTTLSYAMLEVKDNIQVKFITDLSNYNLCNSAYKSGELLFLTMFDLDNAYNDTFLILGNYGKHYRQYQLNTTLSEIQLDYKVFIGVTDSQIVLFNPIKRTITNKQELPNGLIQGSAYNSDIYYLGVECNIYAYNTINFKNIIFGPVCNGQEIIESFIYLGDGLLIFVNDVISNEVRLDYLEFNNKVTTLVRYDGYSSVSEIHKVGDLLYTGMIYNMKSYLVETNVLSRVYKSYLMPYNLLPYFVWGL